MRNTTKLKHILHLYTLTLDMDDEEQFYLVITDKRNGDSKTFTEKTYSGIINKAYSHLLKNTKAKPLE